MFLSQIGSIYKAYHKPNDLYFCQATVVYKSYWSQKHVSENAGINKPFYLLIPINRNTNSMQFLQRHFNRLLLSECKKTDWLQTRGH